MHYGGTTNVQSGQPTLYFGHVVQLLWELHALFFSLYALNGRYVGLSIF